jgi:hypothetical protein
MARTTSCCWRRFSRLSVKSCAECARFQIRSTKLEIRNKFEFLKRRKTRNTESEFQRLILSIGNSDLLRISEFGFRIFAAQLLVPAPPVWGGMPTGMHLLVARCRNEQAALASDFPPAIAHGVFAGRGNNPTLPQKTRAAAASRCRRNPKDQA